MKTKKKVGAYVRVSTSMQEENDSLKTQISKIESYCELHDYDLYKIYEDVGSGGDDERKGFKKLQRDINKKKFDILLVYESSRISRMTNTLINFISKLIEKKVDFISISQPDLNTTTSTGRLFFTINAGLAQYEREKISERVRSSAYEKAKKGHWMGGQLPIGYKRDKQKNIIIDKAGAKQVKNFFDTFLECRSLRKTADLFGRPIESMRWILTNPFYAGKYRFGVRKNNLHNKKKQRKGDFLLVEGTQEPIISREKFEKAQEIIKTGKAFVFRNKKSEFILTGLIRCTCNHKMYGNRLYNKQWDKTYITYQCDFCKKKIVAENIENDIFNDLKRIEELKSINDIDLENEEIVKNLEVYNKRKITLEKELNRLLTLVKKGFIGDIEYMEEKNKTLKDMNYLVEEIDNLNNALNKNKKQTFHNYDLLLEISNNYKKYKTDDLKELLRMLIKEIVILERVNKTKYKYNVILQQ